MVRLCSDRHISVVADTVICYLPSEGVIKYILQSNVGDMRDKTFPMAVGTCLFKANIIAMKEHGKFNSFVDSYAYVGTVQLFSDFDLLRAVSEFCVLCGFVNDFNVKPTNLTYTLLRTVHKTLTNQTYDIMSRDAFNFEYENALSWIDS